MTDSTQSPEPSQNPPLPTNPEAPDAVRDHDAGAFVLAGVDGSEDGMRAVEYARRVAEPRGKRLKIIHAVDDAILAGAWGVVYDPTILQEAGQAAVDEAVARVTADGFPADRIDAEVIMGNPAQVLSRASEKASMMVVGRRSISGLERMFVGSTSVAVAAMAKCPVITISKASNPGRTGGFGEVGVGVDAVPHSTVVLDWAFAEAQERGAKLRVIHVTQEQPTGLLSLLKPTDEQRRAQVTASTERLGELLRPRRERYADVPLTVEVSYGNPVEDLVKHSENLDLLVLGVHHSAMPGKTLGGIVRGVLAHAKAPVCIVR